MKYITDVEGLEGKTIESAKFFDYEEYLILRFNDDEAAVLQAHQHHECIELSFCGENDIGPSDKLDAGIITEEEYDGIRNQLQIKHEREREATELRQLAALKEKYPAM